TNTEGTVSSHLTWVGAMNECPLMKVMPLCVAACLGLVSCGTRQPVEVHAPKAAPTGDPSAVTESSVHTLAGPWVVFGGSDELLAEMGLTKAGVEKAFRDAHLEVELRPGTPLEVPEVEAHRAISGHGAHSVVTYESFDPGFLRTFGLETAIAVLTA